MHNKVRSADWFVCIEMLTIKTKMIGFVIFHWSKQQNKKWKIVFVRRPGIIYTEGQMGFWEKWSEKAYLKGSKEKVYFKSVCERGREEKRKIIEVSTESFGAVKK